ncbi:MAG: Rpn family recombination-promoting nuclease/putative transposase, partial [Myxococcota bacterium]
MSKDLPQTPHDALFKEVFSNPANAASELKFLLPPAIARQLDLSCLTLQPGEFIDKQLRGRQSDLLFSVAIKGPAKRRQAFVYVLYEHLSSHPRDPFFLLRILVYMVRIWEQFVKQNATAKY